MNIGTVIRLLSGTVLAALLLHSRAESQTATVPESAPPPACADAACTLGNAQSLLRNGDTVGAYSLLVTYTLFSDVDSNTLTMKNYAAFVKPRADRLIAQKAIREERSHEPNSIQGTIAVSPFVNIGAREELQPLSVGLPEMLTTDLSQIKRLTVLERAQVSALSAEMALGQTGLLDSSYASRMGKLLSAQWVITGSFSGTGDSVVIRGSLRQTAGCDSGTGSTKVQCALTGIFKAEKELVFSIVNKLGIVLTDDERRAVETIPTENVLAYLAYCKGLEDEERGDFDGAKDRYKAAMDLDPKFEKAKNGLGRASSAAKLGKPAKKSAEKSGSADMKNTPVFSIGPLQLSSIGTAAIASMNTAMAGFMPERPLVSVAGKSVGPANGRKPASAGAPSETERNSYIDATGTDLNSVPSAIKARIPIPPAIR